MSDFENDPVIDPFSPAYARELACTKCGHTVTVHEIPKPYIDPERFVCGTCLDPKAELTLLDDQEREPETRPYDPAVAALPDGF